MRNQTKIAVFLFSLTFFFVFPVASHAGPIKWEAYKDGMIRAKAEKKKVFVNFYADW